MRRGKGFTTTMNGATGIARRHDLAASRCPTIRGRQATMMTMVVIGSVARLAAVTSANRKTSGAEVSTTTIKSRFGKAIHPGVVASRTINFV